MSVQQSATDRLSRLLAMVPYLLARQGVETQVAAAHFGISEDELVADLQLLFVCGLPGHRPDDLIEAEWESGQVYLDNADAISRPLRLGMDEAVSLLAGLRTLAETAGAADVEALSGALAKLTEATGDAGATARSVAVTLDDETDPALLGALRGAVTEHRRVHLRYLVPGRDEVTERDVDPMRVLSLSGRWYLEGWCHRAEDVRLFRLSRVEDAAVLDVDGTPPADAAERDLDTLFSPSATDEVFTVWLSPENEWVVDSYLAEPVPDPAPSSTQQEQAEDHERAGAGVRGAGLPDGGRLVQIRAASTGWLEQLALRSGGGVRVIAPAEVVERVARQSAEALQRYR